MPHSTLRDNIVKGYFCGDVGGSAEEPLFTDLDLNVFMLAYHMHKKNNIDNQK